MSSQNSGIAQQDGGCFVFPKKKSKVPQKVVEPINGVYEVRAAAALVISNDFKGHESVRKGAQEDVDRVIKLLKDDFKVKEPQQALNLTTEKLLCKLKDFAKSKDAQHADCLLVFVMSHGDDGVVKTTPKNCNTNPSVRYQDIWEPILNQRTGKPVLFFIQACRGDHYDEGIEVQTDGAHADQLCEASAGPATSSVDAKGAVPSNSKEASMAVDLPNQPNVLFAFATVTGYYSYRKTSTRDASKIGSYFLRAVCTEMKKRVDTDDVIKVLTRVNRKVASAEIKVKLGEQISDVKQCCSVLSFLTYKVVFPRSTEEQQV